MYRGVIIEESLADKKVLDRLNIVSTEVEKVTPSHATPWLEKWTLHTVEMPEADLPEVAEALSRSMDPKHGGSWYADLRNERWHIIIFRDKIFKVDLSDPTAQYRQAREYGLGLGIPERQLDFTP